SSDLSAPGDRHLRHADAFLRGAVLVGVVGQADLFRRLDHQLQQRHLVARGVRDLEDAVAAAKLVGPAVEALHALVDRQHVLPAPAAIAELRPVIVVLRLAADVDHAVDRARAAQHFPARHLDPPAARAFVGLGAVAPVHRRIVDHLGDADRHARPEEIRAFGAGLEQQHAMDAALAEAAGDDGAGRSGADDDVLIKRCGGRHVWRTLPGRGVDPHNAKLGAIGELIAALRQAHKCPMSDHKLHHGHDHDHGSELGEMQLRVRALETILTEKGYVDPKALDAIVETYETKIGPRNGARVVARAWVDPAFKAALLKDASAAIRTMGHENRVGDHLIAVENTPRRHNVIVCTLCSCYPWEMLGLPPVWYKAAPYRSRAVKDPRGVLADFGLTLPSDTEIRVWDSTA